MFGTTTSFSVVFSLSTPCFKLDQMLTFCVIVSTQPWHMLNKFHFGLWQKFLFLPPAEYQGKEASGRREIIKWVYWKISLAQCCEHLDC